MGLEAVILIPARYHSMRFPGKPLKNILNQSLITRVYDNAVKSGLTTYVVTDHDEIESHVLAHGGKVLRVDDDVPSGSERIFLAYNRHLKDQKFDVIINIQGDEPLLTSDELLKLIDYQSKSNVDIATMLKKFTELGEFENPDVVKAIYDEKTGKCHYFSRGQVPYPRKADKHCWYQHIGVYSYKVNALSKFCQLEASQNEQIEGLEQLRAIDNGMQIGAITTTLDLIGVDRPEDIKKVEERLRRQT